MPFVENNIKSTLNLLEYARRLPVLKHFIYFSTDEVYGSAADGQAYKESDPHKYAARAVTNRRPWTPLWPYALALR